MFNDQGHLMMRKGIPNFKENASGSCFKNLANELEEFDDTNNNQGQDFHTIKNI